MLRLLVLTIVCTLAFVQAAPQSADASATIVSQINTNDGSGNFKTSYETSNAIKSTFEGELKAGKIPSVDANGQAAGEVDGEIQVQRGEYSYQSPDGKNIVTK